jgi:hypothetical protein
MAPMVVRRRARETNFQEAWDNTIGGSGLEISALSAFVPKPGPGSTEASWHYRNSHSALMIMAPFEARLAT